MTRCTWRRIRVADLVASGDAEVKTGPFGTQLHASDYVESGTPVINVRNIGFGGIRADKLEYIAEETVRRLSGHVLHPGDIVFGRKGAVERHVLIRDRQSKWFQGSDCLRLRLRTNRVLPQFLSYYLLTRDHQTWMMQQCSHGATMASLNQDIVGRIEFSAPDPADQEAIASILSAFDDLIENNTRRIAILEEMARRIYEEWFVRFRFPGHENVRMVESELGLVPEGWARETLADCASVTMGQSPSSEFYNDKGEGLPFHQGVTNFGRHFPTHKMFCSSEGRLAEEGDILVSVRAPVGRINLSPSRLVIGRGLCAVRSRTGQQTFLLHRLFETFKEEDSMGNGAIFKAVSKQEVLGLPFLVPHAPLVAAFEEMATPFWSLIRNLTDKNINLRTTRDLLLPKLISGELSVENIEIAREAP